MKIEIGESLIYSYLKHLEGCRIVQTNWKTSGNWTVTEFEQNRARNLFNKIANAPQFEGIFKNSSFEQLMKQAEIDVLGINTTENTVFGIDVAFHTAGLNYGSKEETAIRVVKKIFRTIFIMQSYFNEYEKFNSYFISPKTNPATQNIIDDLIEKAKDLIEDSNISIDFISNDDFYNVIVDPLIKNINDENDTMELFARSVKLLQLDSRKNQFQTDTTKPKTIRKSINKNKRQIDNMLIGQFVQHCFRDAFSKNLISENEILNLQKPEYSKDTFDINFEVLRYKTRSPEDHNGRGRYYKRELFCNDYLLCSQWVEPQWDLFLSWLNKIGYDYKKELNITS
ncbi:MAG: hypothetical protein R3342_01665 [Lutibacter sp.]|uniref:hypothetical protein n=1 Tax=Lutibacter sp. TaxID=1925666 RepID=UPI00299D5398|nr:hypothetical protein [Lutibacter sp.]MDX1828229.1 hypothetical protein [Lutibacter sp.]